MAILCRLHTAFGDRYIQAIREALPNEDVREWPEVGDPAEIEIACIFRSPPGFLTPFTNLKLISSTGAGVDTLVLDPEFPRHIPLVRVVDEDFGNRMAEYAATWVMFHHRDVAHFMAAQRESKWAYRTMRSAREVKVGVMGLGQMGAAAASLLARIGYDTAGWSRSAKSIEGVTCFAGAEGLEAFLARSEIVVNLLPLTDETRGILDAALFAKMPRGGVLISAGRGAHLVEDDLIAALASGQLRGATLDVFAKEPLAPEHPFWTTPGLFVTPHASSTASLETSVGAFAENVRRYRAGEPLLNLVDLDRGY